MKNIVLLFFLIATCNTLFSQVSTDYSQMDNWHFHPNKPGNLLSNYNIDIALVNKDLSIDSVIVNPNNSVTNTGVDVFFVHPTQLLSSPPAPDTISIGDQPNLLISLTIIAQGGILSKYGRFFAPKYRQSSPSAFTDPSFSDSDRAKPLLITYSDVKASFLDYLNNYNGGNKIILVGHSQGAFILGMLLRDLFDNDPVLKSKLVTASLGGIGPVYATPGNYQDGWWENIPLCTQVNECECIHNWISFKEPQVIPNVNSSNLPFNQVLVDSGLVYRKIDLSNDWLIRDSLFYGSSSTPLRNYISPDNNYNLSSTTDFVAFDSLYNVRFKRTSNTHAVLAVDYTNDSLDQRPNDLLPTESHPNYQGWGFHQKDYHIYLWALMEQIDAKLSQCSSITSLEEGSTFVKKDILIYPNPSKGDFRLKYSEENIGEVFILDIYGKVVQHYANGVNPLSFRIDHAGIYFVKTELGTQKILVLE